MPRTQRRRRAALAALIGATALSGCGANLSDLGREPTMSSVAMTRNPIDPTLPPAPLGAHGDPRAAAAAAQRSARAPYPGEPYQTASLPAASAAASLWSSGPRSLFGDRRARRVGDILTVEIDIDDSASLENTSSRSLEGTERVGADTLFGIETVIDRLIPGDAVGLGRGVSITTNSTTDGAGSIERNESISLRIAATVIDVLPNGHLLVMGNQEVRVNFELRDLQVAGIIRPEDVTRQNTISYDKMANARVSYGGRGRVSEVQQPRIGQQIVQTISPF